MELLKKVQRCDSGIMKTLLQNQPGERILSTLEARDVFFSGNRKEWNWRNLDGLKRVASLDPVTV